MPGFTTHYLLGVKAYNDLPNNQLRRIISKYRWLYQLGLQGPDMFFYNIPILRHRDYRNVGSYMHENHPEVRVEIVAIPDAFISHGNPEVLKKEAGMDALSVYKKIKEAYEG